MTDVFGHPILLPPTLVNTFVNTSVNTLVNTFVNTSVNTSVNTLVNTFVNTSVNTSVNTLVNTLVNFLVNTLVNSVVNTVVNLVVNTDVNTLVIFLKVLIWDNKNIHRSIHDQFVVHVMGLPSSVPGGSSSSVPNMVVWAMISNTSNQRTRPHLALGQGPLGSGASAWQAE